MRRTARSQFKRGSWCGLKVIDRWRWGENFASGESPQLLSRCCASGVEDSLGSIVCLLLRWFLHSLSALPLPKASFQGSQTSLGTLCLLFYRATCVMITPVRPAQNLITMPTALTKFTPYKCLDEAISALDARAIGYQEPLVITTPNMDWVLELYNDDSEELRTQADGRFGVVDCFQWPQMYCKEFKYAVCIPHKDTSSIDLQFTWYTPTAADFVIQPGTAFAVSTLHSHIVDGINNLLTIARKHPLTYRDVEFGKGTT
ncbi:hypothetical protein EV702DRAFT_1046313 [Suillus placidus]|uniref:Uncharacterized protein n=1 Tax=Suillus placidus TaxID=48579 RepID=A0A9P6ZTC8_9AGAM|nr:hypothetical protein EV702DRAFT_1046313 [Suillus placidus]